MVRSSLASDSSPGGGICVSSNLTSLPLLLEPGAGEAATGLPSQPDRGRRLTTWLAPPLVHELVALRDDASRKGAAELGRSIARVGACAWISSSVSR